jgi:UDP-N-acetylglucosamine/UDP-N-acetylgalactosamine diphosphorylase
MTSPPFNRLAVPALAPLLERADAAIREAFDWVVATGMGDTFPRYLAHADADTLATFFEDLATVDRAWVERHRQELLRERSDVPPVSTLSPVVPDRLEDDRDGRRQAGRRALATGRWGALIFAGGAATRFFSEAGDDPRVRAAVASLGATPPKGLFPLTPVAGRSFLDLFAAQALRAGITAGILPPLVLMTSSTTAAAIEAWCANADLRGMPREAVSCLPQAEHPRLDAEGNLVVQPDGRLVRTGDGHGGVFRALRANRGGTCEADRLRAMGVAALVLHNVDNAASRAFEPVRLGWFEQTACDFGMTVVLRTKPDEPVGLVAINDATDRVEVVEYSVCPRELAEATDPDGLPRFRLAHINTNLVRLDAVRADLPPTRYDGKQVPVGDRLVATSSHEMLNQHLSGLLSREQVGVLLADRDDCFLPTKRVTGEDSLDTTVAALVRLAADRLRRGGADVAPSAIVELDPCLGPDDDIPPGAGPGWSIGERAALCLAVRHGATGSPWSDGLVLERDALLSVIAGRPYGEVRWDAATRRIAEDPATAGRVSLGANVRVRAGIAVRIRVAGDGVLHVADDTVFEKSCDLDVAAGEVRRIG